MRKLYWYLTAYARKHGTTVIFSIVVAILLFSLSLPIIIKIIDRKPTTYIGLVGDFSLSSLPPIVQRQLSHGLTTIQEDGTPIPDAAERWSIENDGKSYRFVLKKNLKWHDGKTLEPSDVTYSFRDVEVVTTPNDIVFKLPDSFVPFPSVVSQPLFRASTERRWGFITRPTVVGLGRYRVIDYETNGQRLKQLSLESDDDRLVYRMYLTESEAILGFQHGQVDVLTDLTNTTGLTDWSNITVTPILHSDRYLGVFFNNDLPQFSKNVRQALAYATAKPEAEVRAMGPVSPTSWAFFQGGKTYEYDISKALERVLAEPPSQPLNIELTTPITFQVLAESIKRNWEDFGQQAFQACQQKNDIKDKSVCENLKITVNLRINNFPDTSNYQALLVGQEIPSDPDQYPLWHSEQSTNFTRYKNTRIDSLLERGRKTQDRNDRLAIYQEFQEFFLEDSPVIFLHYLESYDVKRN